MSIRTVLFDLDGTLADTAPDLAHTLNTLLAEEGRVKLAYETIRPEVSHGAGALVRLGFGGVASCQGILPIPDRHHALPCLLSASLRARTYTLQQAIARYNRGAFSL